MTELAHLDLGIVGTVLLVAAIVLLVRHGHRWPIHEGRRLLAAALVMAAVMAAVVAGGALLLRFSGVPYNIRELFHTRLPTVSIGLLAMTLLVTGAVPMWLAQRWLSRPPIFAAVGPVCAVVSGLAAFFTLWLAVPAESLDDLVGSPVLNLPPTLERLLRFTGFYVGPFAGLTLGARLSLAGPDRRWWPGLGVLATLGMVSYWTVVCCACTTNVVELLRGGGDAVSTAAVFGLLVLLGLVCGFLARAMSLARRTCFRSVALGLLAAVLAVPVGWQLFVAATNPRLEKYGQAFAARQFLLSPDREHYLCDGALMVRFAAVHFGATLVFGAGMLSATLAHRGPMPARNGGLDVG